jgi:hypothetical protein
VEILDLPYWNSEDDNDTEFCGRVIFFRKVISELGKLHFEADDVSEAAELSPRTHVRRISVIRTAPTSLWKIFHCDCFYPNHPPNSTAHQNAREVIILNRDIFPPYCFEFCRAATYLDI